MEPEKIERDFWTYGDIKDIRVGCDQEEYRICDEKGCCSLGVNEGQGKVLFLHCRRRKLTVEDV